eukprot:g12228.t1
MLLAFTYLKKSPEDHVRLAEEARQRADSAIAEGDIKTYNSELMRAAKHFGSAKAKDANTTGYLYGYVDAHNDYICDNLTAASNQLQSVLSGVASIHDTLSATDEDREMLYKELHERTRMNLVIGQQHPVGMMLSYTNKRLDAMPDDAIAARYKAISLAYMAEEQRTDEQQVLDDLQFLNDTAAANPENPWLESALARYHVGNARRLARAAGGQFTEAVNAEFGSALEHADKALALAGDNMPAYLDASLILADLRSNDEALGARLIKRKNENAKKLNTLLKSKENRDALFIEEIERAIAVLRLAQPSEEDPDNTIDGPAEALALATAVLNDRPEEPAAYQSLGRLQREGNQFQDAEKTIEKGLAIQNDANARQFVRDSRARLSMQGQLADIKCTLALQASELEDRERLLDEANAIIDVMADADALPNQSQGREAQVDFLRGKVLLAQNKPRQAVTYLERANQAANNKDAQTLRLLAQTHARLGNDKLVVGFYEAILTTRRATGEDLLNLINLYINPGEGQQLEKAEEQLGWYRKQAPDDMRAVRLQARLLIQQEKYDEAIALLQEQDLEKHKDLADMIPGIQALGGNPEGAINVLRERLADRPEGEAMNLQVVMRLLNTLPQAEQKEAELDRLVSQGLDPSIADIFKRALTTGQATLDDQLKLIDIQGGTPADIAMKKFRLYQQRGQLDDGRPFLEEANQLEPNRADVIEWRYRLALDGKRWDDAEQAVKDMLKLSPDKRSPMAVSDGRFMRAQALAVRAAGMEPGEEQNKSVREAVVAYNNALNQYSHYVDGWVQLGRLYFAQGNYFAAQDSLTEALNRQSRNVEALEWMGLAEQASGQQINALERFEQVLAIQPGNRSALDRFTALARQIGLTPRAIQLREQIRERVPNNYDNRRVLAVLYAQTESHAKAKQTIEAVIEAEGSTLQNAAILGQVLAADEQHDQAIAAVQGYLTSLGEDTQWRDHLLLASTYETAGKTAEADQAFAKAIELERGEGTFGASLAKAQALLNRDQPEQAAALFEDLVKAFPDNDALKQQTAELYLRLRNFDRAEALAKTLPASAQRDRLIIQSASAQDKLGLAIERAQDASAAYPSDFGIQLNLIELLRAEQDRKPEGDRSYNKLLTMAKSLAQDNPDRVESKVALADVLLRMNRVEQATAILEKAKEFAPRHLATNERLFNITMREASVLVSSEPDTSREKAREALAIASILLEYRPNAPSALRGAGQAAELAGLGAVAVDYYQKTFEVTQAASDLGTYANALLAAGRATDARAVLEGDNATLVSSNLFLRALRGRAIAASGQPDAAANLFTNLFKQAQSPNEQVLITQQVIGAYPDVDKAIAIIENAVGDDLPVEVDRLLAGLLIRQQAYPEVIARLAKYVDKPAGSESDQLTLMSQLALAYQESGQYTEAKAIYNVAYELMNKQADLVSASQKIQLLNNMAYLLVDQLAGYEEEAIDYAKQALSLMGDNANPQQYALIEDTLGWAYFKAGKLEDAIRVLKDSVQRYPLAANQLHLGRAYLALGDQANRNRAVLVLEDAKDQARTEGDEKMIAETEKWYRESLKEDSAG